MRVVGVWLGVGVVGECVVGADDGAAEGREVFTDKLDELDSGEADECAELELEDALPQPKTQGIDGATVCSHGRTRVGNKLG